LVIALSIIVALLTGASEAGEKVALRAGDGRFLRARADGTVEAERLFVGEAETFALVGDNDGVMVLKAGDTEGAEADAPRAEPGDRDVLVLVPAGERRYAQSARGAGPFADVDLQRPEPAGSPDAEPQLEQTFEVFRVAELPPAVALGLGVAIRTLVATELADREYDKTESKRKVHYVKVPAPTLRHPDRTKRHRIFAMREEVRLTARLDGAPKIGVPSMRILRPWEGAGPEHVVFMAEAEMPARGRVRYKVPDRFSASTGFRTRISISLVGEVTIDKKGDEITIRPPELHDVRVRLRWLDISNDLLDLGREPIRDLVNRELRSNHERILAEANEAVRKAVETQQFRHPLLRFACAP
jgi:hypothetical protein